MMRKTMKKILAVTVAATLMTGALGGCGKDTGANPGNATDTPANVTDTSDNGKKSAFVSMTELFNTRERVWFYAYAGSIDKDQQVEGIYVTYPDGTYIYTYGGEDLKTLGEYSQMTDEQIIEYVKHNMYDTRISDTYVYDTANAETSRYVDSNGLKYKFNIITDASGNNVEAQSLVMQSYPDIVSYEDNHGEFHEGRPGEIVTAVGVETPYKFNYALPEKSFVFNGMMGFWDKGDIYTGHYLMLNANGDYETSKYDYGYKFITRFADDEDLSPEIDKMDAEGVVIDKKQGDVFGEEIIYTDNHVFK